MDKIVTIIQKEWQEVFKNRMVIFTVLFLPLFFAVLPLIILFATKDAGMGDLNSELPAQFARMCPPALSTGECFQVYMVSQFVLLFMMVPMIIPVNISAYSIVGEKTTRSLEPLLATPITTAELLAGKNLAATIPAVLATWGGFAIYALGAAILLQSKAALGALLNPTWLLAIILVGPLLAILSVNFSLMVSSRVNDPRVAEQLSAVVIVPLLGLFFGQIAGLIYINGNVVLFMAVLVALLDVVMVYAATRLFARETILTRWK
jgi:ABC-2 type transport system permease protein